MYHSIDFKVEYVSSGVSKVLEYNTFEDFHIVPTSRPVFTMPDVKTKTIEVPGANGIIDLSEALTGYPVYANRSGSFKFAVLNDIEDWTEIYSKVANALHGKKAKAVLEDDPDWYYEGRWSVGSLDSPSNGTWSSIDLAYNVSPFKYSHTEKTRRLQNTSSTTQMTITLKQEDIGQAPTRLNVTTNASNLRVKVENLAIGYTYGKTFPSAGTYDDPGLIMFDPADAGVRVTLMGAAGQADIKFRVGRL